MLHADSLVVVKARARPELARSLRHIATHPAVGRRHFDRAVLEKRDGRPRLSSKWRVIMTKMTGIPTVKFDTSYLTQDVLEALERDIRALPETNEQNFDEIYDIAVRAIAAGGDLYLLSRKLIARDVAGVTGQRASRISTLLWRRTRNRIDQIRATEAGLTHAIWMYSNGPCMDDPGSPSAEDLRRDAAHKAANGKRYRITEGLRIGGRHIWPGDEDGCRCVSRTIVPGFED